MEKLISKAAAAEMLDVSIDTLDRLVRRGELPMYRISGSARFLESELLQFVYSNQVRPQSKRTRTPRVEAEAEIVIHYIQNQIVV